MDELLNRTLTHAQTFIDSLPTRHVGARATREERLAALKAPLTPDGESAEAVVDLIASQGDRGAVACAGPRYFGFVTGGSRPAAPAAGWRVSTWDQHPGIYAPSRLIAATGALARRWARDT